MCSVLHQSYNRRKPRRLHRVGQAAEELARFADSRAGPKNQARQLARAGLRRRTAGGLRNRSPAQDTGFGLKDEKIP